MGQLLLSMRSFQDWTLSWKRTSLFQSYSLRIRVIIAGQYSVTLVSQSRLTFIIILHAYTILKTRIPDANECIEKKIDVYSEYSDCKYLFRCLLDTGDNKIGHLVAKATSINTSTKLINISDIFRQLNKTIQHISHNKATKSMNCFRTQRLFPLASKKKLLHDSLRTLDDVSWFIANVSYPEFAAAGNIDLYSSYIALRKLLDPPAQLKKTEEKLPLKATTGKTFSSGTSSPYKGLRTILRNVRNKVQQDSGRRLQEG